MEQMLKIAVCDDEEIICEFICTKICKFFNNRGIKVSCDKYAVSKTLCKKVEEGIKYDIAFLDIDMPKLDGLDLGKTIRKELPDCDIIFVSNHEDRVFETFDIQPFNFIRKNNFNNDLKDTLHAYINKKILSETYVALKTYNGTVIRKVKISDIVYIESFRNQQVVHMADETEITIRMTMKELETSLSPYDIIRVYKGYLVNFQYVQRLEKMSVVVNYKEGVTINVSRERLQELKLIYLEYLRKIGTIFIGDNLK